MYRKGRLTDVTGEKTTEEHLNKAVIKLGEELGVDINDFYLYLDSDRPVSRYILLIEPDTKLDVSKTKNTLMLLKESLEKLIKNMVLF